MTQEELQQKYMEFQMMSQQANQMKEQLQAFEQQAEDLNKVLECLTEIENTKLGTEILIPMSSGIFLKAELKDNKEVNVNVGSNVSVKKSIPKTKDLITTQIKEIESLKQRLNTNLQLMGSRAKELEAELESLVGEK